MSLDLKWVYYRLDILTLYLLIHSASLSLLNEKFYPFIFKILLIRKSLLFPYFYFFSVCHKALLSLFASLLPYFLLIFFVMIYVHLLLIFFCVYSIHIFFCAHHGDCRQCSTEIASNFNWYQFNFKSIQNFYFYTNPFLQFYIIDVTNHLFLHCVHSTMLL